METRVLQKSGETISLLGFGCMRLPILGDDPAKIDEALAQNMVDYALANGVNYFDTAYMYHNGASEPFIGKALSRYPRESFYLATKMPPWMVESEADVDRIFEEQLHKCRVGYFDFYLIHNITASKMPGIIKHRIIEKLNEKREQGLIRKLGFSYHDRAAYLPEVIAKNDWDFAQIQLNYLDWQIQDADQLYDILTSRKLPIIVMEPVRGGILASLGESAGAILKTANPGVSIASWAMRFVASLPNVLTVLSGMSNMDQLRDNVATLTHFSPLTDTDKQTLEAAVTEYKRSGAVPCTGCQYCMECPAGVDIPKVFAVYNQYCVLENGNQFIINLGVLGNEKLSHNCIECGECVDKCPQHLNIPALLRTVGQKAEQVAETVPAFLRG